MLKYLRLLVVLSFCMAGLFVQAAEYAWIEGETPTKSAIKFTGHGWGNASLLSDGKWLRADVKADQLPTDGSALFSYDFTLATAGTYEIWDRNGLPSLKQPFQWRIDNGAWKDVTGNDYPQDLQRIEFFCEVCWWKLGSQDLTAGTHSLQIRSKHTTDNAGKVTVSNINFTADAFCIYKGQFKPNGKYKTDAAWQTETDKQAATQVFSVETPKNGNRVIKSLAGNWQVARYDEEVISDRDGAIKTMPKAEDCYWAGINVPGDKYSKQELNQCHRLIYRTRVNVPADAAGKSFILNFPCNSMITTVFVNGVYCGFTRAPYAAWDCDITKAVKPGQDNEIWVGIKDTYYARPDITPGLYYIPTEHWNAQWVTERFDFPVAGRLQTGMLKTPTLTVTGPSYAADVFAISSVKNKQLTLETTVQNPTDKNLSVTLQNEIFTLTGTKPEKVFDPITVVLTAGSFTVASPKVTWNDVKLWWPDDPQQYIAVTKIVVEGNVVDTIRTKFGFREWEWAGINFKLNGVPFHGRADLHNYMTSNPAGIADMKKDGTTMQRLWGSNIETPSSLVDVYDAAGMPVRYTGIFDGQGGAYGTFQGGAPSLFAHWNDHLAAWVKEYRNHPSIFLWSIENEITYINVRNWGRTRDIDPLMRESGKLVMSIDPTRPVMVDGGRALVDNSLPVYGCHYEETAQRDYPDEAYTLNKMMKGVYTWQVWPIDRTKPILIGESFFARGFAPSWYAGLMGEGAFSGRTEAAKGIGIFSKMLSEGYRWSDVNFHYWHGDESNIYYNSWQPIALLSRQWNWSFGSGEQVLRNLRVFNDTHYADPITVKWTLTGSGGKSVVGSDSKVFTVAPGMTTDWDVTIPMPKVTKRTQLQLILTCEVKGKELFRDVKDISIINSDNNAKPALKASELLVLDLNGSVIARLNKRGIAFTEIKRFEDLPLTTNVVIVGKDSLTPAQASSPKWKTLASIGAKVIVLEQTNRLRDQALPADLTIVAPTESNQKSEFFGRIAFPENPEHPVFNGLTTQDFFTWSNDHIVYRNPYKKASHGATSLVQCDLELGYTALSTCAVNNGLLIPCQLTVGEKLDSNAVAQQLFDNLLNYAASYQPIHKITAITMAPTSPQGKMIAESGLEYQTIPDVVEAISNSKIDIVIAEANPETLAKLAKEKIKLQAFTARGGYIMLWGLDEKGLADFNAIVGIDHLIRQFEMEKVTLPTTGDPLIAGLTMRDVVMESGQQINLWSGDKFMADDIFTSVVDVNDVAAFSTIPDGKYYGYDDSKPGWDHWPRNMFNGFTSVDSWKYCFTIVPPKSPTAHKWTMTYPQTMEFTEMKILFTGIFNQIQRVNLYFDNDPKPFTYMVGQNWKDTQTITLDTPRKAKVITVELPDFANTTNSIFGIDNMWLYVKRPENFEARVKPLLNIGALVKYPMGKGGVILNNLRIQQTEGNPVNSQKKRNIVSTILRNLNATFSGGNAVASGSGFNFTPLDLGAKCNAFLTNDKGWPDVRDLGMLPKGDNVLNGVSYNIRDFKTSPLPSCIMLGGTGAPAGLPNALTAIPVAKKADALFFLHTARQFKNWTAPKTGDQTPPVVFQYVINYANGTTEIAPVRLGWEVDNWVNATPQNGKNSTVAWATSFPNDKSKDQAVAYQYIWANPHPELEITSVDIAYPGTGATYAVPVLLGITTATMGK